MSTWRDIWKKSLKANRLYSLDPKKGNNAFAELQDEVVCKAFVIFLNYLFFPFISTYCLTLAKKLNQNLSLDWNPEVELAVKQGETAGSMNASEGWKAS